MSVVSRATQVFPAILMIVASAVALVGFGARPLDASVAAGVFPPWWTAREAQTAAAGAGDILAAGALPFIVIVRAPHADQRLRAAGALFSIDARGAGVCNVRVPGNV